MIRSKKKLLATAIFIALIIILICSINVYNHLPPRILKARATSNVVEVEISTSNYSTFGVFRKISCVVLAETKSPNTIKQIRNKSFTGLSELLECLKDDNVTVLAYEYSHTSVTDVSLYDDNTEKIVFHSVDMPIDSNRYILGLEYSRLINTVDDLKDANQECVLIDVRKVRMLR
jgi:hypothetical protein